MKETLKIELLKYLDSAIDLTDFNTIESSQKYYLRFELGDPFKNGTKKRVTQATKRATQLFENYIEEDFDLYIIVYDLFDEIFARTPNYLYEILDSKLIEKEQFEENLALPYFPYVDDEIERIKGKLTIYKTKRGNINYNLIFNGIANTEMGFLPTVHQLVYFFQPKTKKWFWMYDDRGCLMFSESVSDLKPSYLKFNDWLVETQRPEMEEQFK